MLFQWDFKLNHWWKVFNSMFTTLKAILYLRSVDDKVWQISKKCPFYFTQHSSLFHQIIPTTNAINCITRRWPSSLFTCLLLFSNRMIPSNTCHIFVLYTPRHNLQIDYLQPFFSLSLSPHNTYASRSARSLASIPALERNSFDLFGVSFDRSYNRRDRVILSHDDFLRFQKF